MAELANVTLNVGAPIRLEPVRTSALQNHRRVAAGEHGWDDVVLVRGADFASEELVEPGGILQQLDGCRGPFAVHLLHGERPEIEHRHAAGQ